MGNKRVIDRGENEKSKYIRCEQEIPPVVQFLVWRMQIFTPYIRHAIIFNTGCHVNNTFKSTAILHSASL